MTWSRQSRRLPGPVELEALAMPANDGLRLHEDEGALPVWPQARERDPECAVRLGKIGVFGLALQNGPLRSQAERTPSEASGLVTLTPRARTSPIVRSTGF
jgi:hypothetical protein